MSRVWFTDRDLGKRFPAILAEAGLQVERHGELFAPDGSDEQWLAHCGTRGRVAITHDQRIRYVPNELAAVRRFKVQLVVVVGHASTAELARIFVASIHRVQACLDRHPGPAILKLYRGGTEEVARSPTAAGRVELWYPKG